MVLTLVARDTAFEAASSFGADLVLLALAFVALAMGFAIGAAFSTTAGSLGPAALLLDLGGMFVDGKGDVG